MSHSGQPVVGFEELDIDQRWVFIDARYGKAIKMIFDDMPVFYMDGLVHGVAVKPADLAFDLFFHRQCQQKWLSQFAVIRLPTKVAVPIETYARSSSVPTQSAE